MGNNLGKGNGQSAKVMKINGEYFKVKTPAKVIDIIKDYPDHILLDSEEFLRYNLRAKPLDLEDELKPRKIYLLFSLPKFPEIKSNDDDVSTDVVGGVNKSPLRRVRSGVSETTTTSSEVKHLMTKRSVSDLSIKTKSTAAGSNTDSEDGGSYGGSPVVGPTRVKMRLPKAQVERIMEESIDDVEVAQRILQLFTVENGGDTVVHVEEDGGGRSEGRENVVVIEEEEEEEAVNRHCFNVYGMCSPRPSYQQRKYDKLSV